MKTDHIVMDADKQVARCNNCGAEYPLPLPMEVSKFVKWTEGIVRGHNKCKPQGELFQYAQKQERILTP